MHGIGTLIAVTMFVRVAMENKVKIHDDSAQEPSRQLQTTPPADKSRENAVSIVQTSDVEYRLDTLRRRVLGLKADSSLVWLEDRLHIFDPALDLRVKVEAVHLMLRAAELLGDSDKEKVLLTVRNSLDQLEKAVELDVHAA
jgi:hypothetical protein